MSLFVDLQFVPCIAHLLRNFKKKADFNWNFSCPMCGDSAKHKLKARGYLYRWNDGLVFKCHNEGCTSSFGNLIKILDENVHKEYRREKFKEQHGMLPKPEQAALAPRVCTPPDAAPILTGLPSIDSLPSGHPAREFIENRLIPPYFFNQLFWADDFAALGDKVRPNHYPQLRQEGRVVIPFVDATYRLLAVQGRSLDPAAREKYITLKTSDEAERIYGQHRLEKDCQQIYIVEGPFDSMFIPNCLAMAGSDIPRSFPHSRIVIAYDNEPYKADTCKKLTKAIAEGYRVVIWPNHVTEKDINEMVLAGRSPDRIKALIDDNSHAGLQATLALRRWRRD